ncbi:MAG: RNA polymerase sigma factor [Acidimicrobiales bacterium]|nr:MAG: RNA polymerase sigma factor [Acidimicrobiales bacterium]
MVAATMPAVAVQERSEKVDEAGGFSSLGCDVSALVERHLPLVRHIVFQVAVHFPRHVDRQELAHAGALGLVEAARRYDPQRGVPFEKFAARRIKGAILDAARSADWAPRSVRMLARSLEQAEQQLASRLGRIPSAEEVAEEIGISEEELRRLQDRMFRSVVLALEYEIHQPGEEDLSLVDVVSDRTQPEPAEELEAKELLGYLRDAVALLPEKLRVVIVGYFLEGKSSAELARILGVTESRISQLRSEALEMLRDGIGAQFGLARTSVEKSRRSEQRLQEFVRAVGASSTWRERIAPAVSASR